MTQAAPRAIYGYVWFDTHMEQRFTHVEPRPDQNASDVVIVYRDPPPVTVAPFSVSVATYLEGKDNVYLVQLTSDHLPAGHDGIEAANTFTPFTTGIKEHAESEARDWAGFLGVNYTPA